MSVPTRNFLGAILFSLASGYGSGGDLTFKPLLDSIDERKRNASSHGSDLTVYHVHPPPTTPHYGTKPERRSERSERASEAEGASE